jgi:hypothetical protein
MNINVRSIFAGALIVAVLQASICRADRNANLTLWYATGSRAANERTKSQHQTFYVDSERGQDSADGLSADSAWQSLERVNAADFVPGDTIRFKCGGRWRGSLQPASGDETAPITYTSYGRGAKPLLLGSKSRSQPEDWMRVHDGVWATLPMEYRKGKKIIDVPNVTWRHHQEAGASIKLTQDVVNEVTTVGIACLRSGQKPNHIQLWGPEVSVEKGNWLQFSFRARSSIPFELSSIAIRKSVPPWTGFASSSEKHQIAAGWQEFQAIFQATQSSADGKLHVNLGGTLPRDAVFEFQPGQIHTVTPSIPDSLDADVGNIIFDEGKRCGWKKWTLDSLQNNYDFYYEGTSRRIYVKSPANPATQHTSIECALKRHVVNQTDVHHIVYDGLAVMYGAAHGFGGGNTHHLVIRNCDVGYIGGGHHLSTREGVPVRYGNGIEFWAAASDHLVENCRIWEVYDAALTNQNQGSTVRQQNIIYRNNLIWNCEYSFEYWNRPESSSTRNVRFVNNTCVNAGVVWSHAQRPDPNGSHLMFYSNTAETSGLEIKHNIFCGVTDWGSRYSSGWKSLPTLDHNLWFSKTGVMSHWFGKRVDSFRDYQNVTGLDAHSLFADPEFVDPDEGDYRPGPLSPARKILPDGGCIGAEWLWNGSRL